MSLFQSGIDLSHGVQAVIDDEDINSDSCLTDLSEDEADREAAFQQRTAEVAAHLDILDPHPPNVLSEADARRIQDVIDMQEITEGFALLAKASKIQQKAYSKISAVLGRNPAMSPLACTMQGAAAQSDWKMSEGSKPVPVVQAGPITAPMAIKGEKGFNCRFCSDRFSCWESADSHTRKFHTFEKYACNCGKFKTTNRGSLRYHARTCAEKELI